jgi:predicted TIM-barrel fold metal-dependent hydrolase
MFTMSEMQKQPIIDAHAMLGREFPLALDAKELLHRMGTHEVELAIARPMGAELVVDNRAGNDRVLTAGPRIRGLVSANPWFGERAVDELKRCQAAGAAGMFLHPSRQGFSPIEPVASPLLEFAANAKWPVMFHTGTYIHSDVLAVAEVARRYPKTNFILGCGGFADMWFEIPGVMQDVPNLWLDTSHTLGDGIRNVIKTAGHDRVIFGSGEPSNCYASSLRSLSRLQLSAEGQRAVLHDNAKRLFRLA